MKNLLNNLVEKNKKYTENGQTCIIYTGYY